MGSALGADAGERTGTVGNEQEPRANGEERRFPAARLRQPEAAPSDEAVPAEGYERGPAPSRSPFAPRSFAGGRVRVFGCTPAWLLISLVASIVLTLVLNLIVGLF